MDQGFPETPVDGSMLDESRMFTYWLICVGKYTSPMDPIWEGKKSKKTYESFVPASSKWPELSPKWRSLVTPERVKDPKKGYSEKPGWWCFFFFQASMFSHPVKIKIFFGNDADSLRFPILES